VLNGEKGKGYEFSEEGIETNLALRPVLLNKDTGEIM
jgi:hypothetical protein